MKKIILTSAGITLAALLIAPKFVGNHLESQLEEVVTALDAHPVYGAEILSYEQGWFHSHGKIALQIKVNDLLGAQQGDTSAAQSNPTIIATFNASHGPVYVGDASGVGQAHYTFHILGDELREHIQWDPETSFYHNEGVIGLFGGLDYQDTLAAFSASAEEDNFSLSFSGYQGTAESAGDAIHYQGNAGEISMRLAMSSMTLSNLQVDMTTYGGLLAAIRGDMFESQAQLAVDSLILEDEESNIVLNDMLLRSDSALEDNDNLVSLNLEYAIASLVADDYKASDLKLGMTVNNLDTDFIKAYQKFNNETLSTAPAELSAKVDELIEGNLLPFLAASPELNITTLSGTFPEGTFDAHLNSKIVEVDALPDALDDAQFWLQHTAADTHIKADKGVAQWLVTSYVSSQLSATAQAQSLTPQQLQAAVAQQVPVVLQTLVQQGILVENDESYETELVLKEGSASINGTKVPIPL